jgi:hypothetical protein
VNHDTSLFPSPYLFVLTHPIRFLFLYTSLFDKNHLSSSGGHQLGVGTMQVTGTLTLNNVALINYGTINVATSGSLTVNGAFACGTSAQHLNVMGQFAIHSPNSTSLACTTAGSGTLATYSQLSISTSFGINSIPYPSFLSLFPFFYLFSPPFPSFV